MSSPRSPQPADGLAALGDAVRQVAEASLFACAEPCDASRTAGLLQARPPAEAWLTAAVAFTGPFEGVVRVTLPGPLAGDLAGAFCGTQPDALDAFGHGPHERHDGTGAELTRAILAVRRQVLGDEHDLAGCQLVDLTQDRVDRAAPVTIGACNRR